MSDQGVNNLPDQELLRRFRNEHDETAFHGLLRRHGPMVLDVCRNVLDNDDDAEDAFQATFLIFAQKAASIQINTPAARALLKELAGSGAHMPRTRAAAEVLRRLER
jgi:hypothetical protein